MLWAVEDERSRGVCMSVARFTAGHPPELVVYDKPQRCPYLRDRVARMPLRLPSRALDREELDERLEQGDRRQGFVLYRTACPTCAACEPIRLDVHRFKPSAAQRRVLRRGDRALSVEIGPTVLDARHIELYNAHKQGRHLDDGQPPIDADGYRDFLVNTCCDTFELRYYLGAELVGVAITDRGARALSAVYCCYDPRYQRLGIGTFSILKQLELCQTWGLRYLYLGLYIAESEKMAYKARFLPHERLVNGRWVETPNLAHFVAEMPSHIRAT
jgi:leucyl-tRNA---protein transferase